MFSNFVLGNCWLKTLTRASRPSFSEPADHQVTTSTWLASPSPAAPPDFEPELPEVAQAARVAATAVVMLTIIAGQPPVQALMLAFSFGFYGLVKKRVDMSAMASLTAETLILAPVAAGYLLVLEARGTGTFGHVSVGHSLLLMTAGLVTAVPLLLFGIAARRIQLSTIGMLQYLTPTMQMLWAVFVTREEIAPLRWVAFGIIWVAVALYFLDILRFRSANGRRKASTG